VGPVTNIEKEVNSFGVDLVIEVDCVPEAHDFRHQQDEATVDRKLASRRHVVRILRLCLTTTIERSQSQTDHCP